MRYVPLVLSESGLTNVPAFVIAWGGFATQAACFIGLFILFLELRRLGIKRWEIFMFLVWLVLAAGSPLLPSPAMSA